MKVFCAALLVVCGLSADIAVAATWLKVVDSGTSRIFIDTESIILTGDIVAAWYMRDFYRPMSTGSNHRLYKSSKVLNYYSCPSREIAAAQWITYENNDGKGRVISNEKVISLSYGDVPPGEAGEIIFDFVCKYVKKHKPSGHGKVLP